MSTSTTGQIVEDEHAPLLGDDDSVVSSNINAEAEPAPAEDKGKHRLRTQLVAVLFACALSFQLHVSAAPETSIREDIICKDYYNQVHDNVWSHDRRERDCTVDAVQRELTLINQVYATLAQLPGKW